MTRILKLTPTANKREAVCKPQKVASFFGHRAKKLKAIEARQHQAFLQGVSKLQNKFARIS
jgi:hypothetical protein